ncbi:MAG: hypothetical protein IJS67_04660 [Clostridia bacterium]|nr:hypothetical protein [Clostridia bacterium]
MKIVRDNCKIVCSAAGCDRLSSLGISFFGVESDIRLCEKCFGDLYVGMKKFMKENKANVGQ